MMLLAIKGLHVQPDVKITEEQSFINLSKMNAPPACPTDDAANTRSSPSQPNIGVFNENGDMIMLEDDVERAIALFKDLSQNRLLHEQ